MKISVKGLLIASSLLLPSMAMASDCSSRGVLDDRYCDENQDLVADSPKNPDPEKLSAYECGFEAFGNSRMEFDVRFYLVAILFIIFDLEIAFLFPWAISLGNIGALGFWSMMIFLLILTIGFIYEWKKGALDWD